MPTKHLQHRLIDRIQLRKKKRRKGRKMMMRKERKEKKRKEKKRNEEGVGVQECLRRKMI